MDKNNDINFTLLQDKPILPDKEEDLRFGHKEIAETIFSVIQKAESPFNIGLYGKWGTGKTTVSGLIEEMARNKKYETFCFDVWKYERDSLRRQFLIELDKKLKLGLDFKESLNQSCSIDDPTKGEIKFDSRLFFNKLGCIFLVILIAGVAGIYLNLFQNIGDAFLLVISETLTSLGLAAFIFQGALGAIVRAQFTYTKVRVDSAEGFEDRFDEALSKISKEKLLVIIDNLDRIDDKKAVEVLSDIKTFLSKDGDQSKVVFLIPCDHKAITSQLLSIYGKGFDADEFLRKFFNLTFRIPKFIDLDLDNYVRELLLKADIDEFKDNKNLEDVIIYSFRDNPREIKQFINSLISQVLLAKRRNHKDVIENIPFLAKLLILQQKYPILYSILEEKSLRSYITLDDEALMDFYKKALELADYKPAEIDEKVDKFQNFNHLTNGINDQYLDIYLTLRKSEDEESIKEWSSYVLAAEENQQDVAERIFLDLKNNKKLIEFDKLLENRVKKIKKGIKLANFVSTSLKICKSHNEKLTRFFDISANYFPYGDNLLDYKDKFNPDDIFSFWYPNTRKEIRNKLVPHYISAFRYNNGNPKNKNYYIDTLKTICNNVEIFKKYSHEIRSIIESIGNFHNYPFISQFNSLESQNIFLTETTKINFVNTINVEMDNFENVLEFWNKLKFTSLTGKLISFRRYKDLLNVQGISTEKRSIIIKSLHKFIIVENESLRGNAIELKDDLPVISQILSTLYIQAKAEEKKIYVPVVEFIASLDGNSYKSILENNVSEFIRNSSDDELKSFGENKIKEWTKKYTQVISDRSINNPKILIEYKLYEDMSENNIQNMVLNLINHHNNIKNAILILKESNYKVSAFENIIDALLNRIPMLNFQDQDIVLELLDSLQRLGINKYANRINTLYSHLKNAASRKSIYKSSIQGVVELHKDLFNPGQLNELLSK